MEQCDALGRYLPFHLSHSLLRTLLYLILGQVCDQLLISGWLIGSCSLPVTHTYTHMCNLLLLSSSWPRLLLSNQQHYSKHLLFPSIVLVAAGQHTNILMSMQGLLRDGPFKNLSSPSYPFLPQLDLFPLSSAMSSLIPSLRALSKAALTYSQFALLSSSNTVSGGSPDTCSNPQTSCQNTSAVANTCCFNAPGGQLLQVRQDAQPPFARISTDCYPNRLNFGTPTLPLDQWILGPFTGYGRYTNFLLLLVLIFSFSGQTTATEPSTPTAMHRAPTPTSPPS